jgi:hypothetical protein
MKRLFVIGCSYSSWVLPTWADFLGTGYDRFENWAVQGIGNNGILQRLSECIMSNEITEDDTIIVQWTDFHRFDYHQIASPEKLNWSSKMHWSSMGGIWATDTHDKFVRESWDEFSYVMHSMNHINCAIGLLKNLPCKWFMTSSIDLTQDFEKFPSLDIYKSMFDDPRWLPYLDSIAPATRDKILIITPTITYDDDHLTPRLHNEWLKKHLLSKLDITIDETLLSRIENVLGPNNELVTNEYNADLVFLVGADWTRLSSVVTGL